jgi:hypothetical protein
MPLFVTVTLTVKYAPGFVVVGRADPLDTRASDATETARRRAKDLTTAG